MNGAAAGRVKHLIGGVGAALLLAACTTAWHPVPPDAMSGRETHRYSRVLVVTRDGYERELVDATLGPDSLTGTRTDSAHARLAVPIADVSRLESREVDPAPAISAVAHFLADAMVEMAKMIRCILTRC